MASLQGHTSRVGVFAYSPDGSFIATGSFREVRIWDASEGRLLFSLEGHKGTVRSIAFSPDGSRIVTASSDGLARVWDVLLETRSPQEILETVNRVVSWRLEGGRLLPKEQGGGLGQ